MKRLLYIVFIGVLSNVALKAQQRAQYTQYIMNNYVLNPAAGGINNYWDFKTGFRKQWVNFDGAPTTVFASLHGPIGYPDSRVRKSHLKPHQGIGGYIFRDAAGPISMTGFYLSYSYHLKISEKYTASAGAFLGMLQYSLNEGRLVFVQNPNDPSLGNISGKMLPDATIGIWVHSDKLFWGISMNQLFGSRTGFTNISRNDARLNYHYFFTGGYKIKVSPTLDFIPSLMVKYVQSAPLQLDINMRLKYNNLVWGGISYRKEDAIAALVGCMLNNKFEIGYSYDLTTSRMNASSRGSHEIILGINFAGFGNKRGRVLCPMDFWN